MAIIVHFDNLAMKILCRIRKTAFATQKHIRMFFSKSLYMANLLHFDDLALINLGPILPSYVISGPGEKLSTEKHSCAVFLGPSI